MGVAQKISYVLSRMQIDGIRLVLDKTHDEFRQATKRLKSESDEIIENIRKVNETDFDENDEYENEYRGHLNDIATEDIGLVKDTIRSMYGVLSVAIISNYDSMIKDFYGYISPSYIKTDGNGKVHAASIWECKDDINAEVSGVCYPRVHEYLVLREMANSYKHNEGKPLDKLLTAHSRCPGIISQGIDINEYIPYDQIDWTQMIEITHDLFRSVLNALIDYDKTNPDSKKRF